jgi:hypothetical protein
MFPPPLPPPTVPITYVIEERKPPEAQHIEDRKPPEGVTEKLARPEVQHLQTVEGVSTKNISPTPPVQIEVVPPDLAENEQPQSRLVWKWGPLRHVLPGDAVELGIQSASQAQTFGVAAVIIGALCFALAISISCVTRPPPTDGSPPPPPLNAVGIAACVLGVMSAMALFATAVGAIISSMFASARNEAAARALPRTVLIYIAMSTLALVLLIPTVVLAGIASNENEVSESVFLVICILCAAICIPAIVILAIWVSVTTVFRWVISRQ